MTMSRSSRAAWKILSVLALLALSTRGAAAADCWGGNLDFAECKARCDRGDMAGCLNLAVIYNGGFGVEKNDGEVLRLSRMACERSDGALRLHACTNLGGMYANGQGTPRDYGQSLGLFEIGCNGGVPHACANLAFQYERGLGVAADQAKAEKLYQQAARAYQRGCDGNHTPSCEALGDLYKRGRGVPKDLSKARALYERACRGGWKPACASAQQLPSN